ncbi:ECF RNA polymerase sigma factor SigW [Paenibacillus plantiphilus]|uniref:ECF RNA polymerase sigma factor SigW n=1 Tax=Paenibacillus plantiphilus TaxID=2905650 RepID=A0ABM9BZ78_9BACL|nr:RNA polymerase sigma factor [Paenibacillus plantiphilus]CAH1199007.1 ECF RNA polymerase sigma factor SigW [Paenibacillus plantiphilus]
MDAQQLHEAVQCVKAGDKASYACIVKHHQQALYIYCYHLLMQREEAEDALQEVFIKAYEKIHTYTYGQSFTAWLYTIAYHQCVNVLRRRKRSQLMKLFVMRQAGSQSEETGYENIERESFDPLLRRALLRLSPAERALVVHRIIEEKSYEEISVILNSSPANLRKKVERVRRKLRHIWSEMEEKEYGQERNYQSSAEPTVGKK